MTAAPPTSYEAAFRYDIAPHADDIDVHGHVNNVVYVRWVQEAAAAHWRAVAPAVLQEAVTFIVLHHDITYRTPLALGDRVEIRTWLGRASGPRFLRHVDIRKAGAARPSALAATDWCMLDATTGRPKRVDETVFSAFGVTAAELG